MKKSVLLICPWLSLDGAIGSFFREQAEVMSTNYTPFFIKFQMHGLKSILRNKFVFSLKEETTKENRTVFTLQYPSIRLFPSKLNQYLLNKSINYLFNKLKKSNIHINLVHCQSVMNVGHWALLIKKIKDIPYINTEHNQVSFKNFSKDKVTNVEEALEKAEYNLAISSDKIRQFAANRLFPDFVFIGNMINPLFKYIPKEKESEFKIITIGAFDPIKDHKTMLKALELLDNKVSKNIRFEWIGANGWGINQDKKTNKFLKKFTLKNISIKLTPYLGREEICKKLQESNLFLFSSISEGMPVSVLEALACGTPIVTTNCGGVDNVINDINGNIVPVGDFKKLSDKLFENYLNRDKIDYQRISKDILSKFGSETYKQNLLEIYNSCT